MQDDREYEQTFEGAVAEQVKRPPALDSDHPFCIWLRQQTSRTDNVGSFAQACVRDLTLPGEGSPDAIRRYLRKHGARKFVLTTMDQAAREFEADFKRYKTVSKRRAKGKVARAARKRNR
jgi:hypothetical protein